MTKAALAEQLLDIGALRLLYGLGGEDAQNVWDSAGQGALSQLALDRSQSAQARFLAAELLADRAPGWVPASDTSTVAELYVRALTEQLAPANGWGLPGSVGPTGEHLLALGDAANAALRQALNHDGRVHYDGSREVGVGERARWRVKDVAATLLASALGRDFPADAAPARRDAAIDALGDVAGAQQEADPNSSAVPGAG